MVRIYPSDAAARKVESWGSGIIPGKWGDIDPRGESSKSRGFQGGQRRRAILESWCYTRRNGAALIQADGCPIPGSSSRCSMRHNSREGSDVLIYTSGQWRCDLQSVVYTRVVWETAITKSNLAFVYNRSLPDSVYTRSLSRFCLYKVIARLWL